MGIQGLLPFLAKHYVARKACIREFENEVVAIDAYCWLHRGLYSCAVDIAMGKPNTQYVQYCMRYIDMLVEFNIKPILVFDGKKLSSKLSTERKREEDRKNKRQRGQELLRAGHIIEGKKLLAESVDVTHKIALPLIKACREKNIDCIVAPYEADAQLAYFSINNIAKCIVTIDSDLLAYGCEKVMLKMDQNGCGDLYEMKSIYHSLGFNENDYSMDKFRHMCILAGCDYLSSLPSIGPAYAYKFVKMHNDNNILEALPRLPLHLNKMNIKITPEYINGFIMADKTFKHQLVYDPFHRKEVPLRPVKNDDSIVGEKSSEDFAFQLALGNIDPITEEKYDDYDPDETGNGFNILWRTDSSPRGALESVSGLIINSNTTDLHRNNGRWFKNHFEKGRIPKQIGNDRTTEKAGNNIPKTVLVFEPAVSNNKKNGLKTVDESDLFRSRYFSTKNEVKIGKNTANHSTSRQKNESYDEYLQRLYTEHFSVDEDEKAKNEFCCEEREKMSDADFCLTCDKCPRCCKCTISKNIPDTQKLNECMKELEHFQMKRQESLGSHCLLDEIQKGDNEEISCKKIQEVYTKVNSLDANLSGECTLKAVVDENSIVENDVKLIKTEPQRRSVSPVFKIQKESKTLNNNFKREYFVDTAGTTTSVYFSPSSSQSAWKDSNSTPSSKRFSAASNQKFSSIKRSGSSSLGGKCGSNSSSAARTLFQFGFKKQRMSKEDL